MKTALIVRKISLLLLVEVVLFSCRKKEALPSTPHITTDAYVIGFDPCSLDKGLVLRLLNSSDTVVTYTLPVGLHTFSPVLFQGYMNNFLFPPAEQNNYKVLVDYYPTPTAQEIHSLCQGNINLADFNRATKRKQITITAAQKIN